jgi:phosphate transport system permease protein
MNEPSEFQTDVKKRRSVGKILAVLFFLATVVGVVVLLTLLAQVVIEGYPWLSGGFFTEFPSRLPENAGILSALVGTFWLMLLTGVISVPLGVGTAIYLEEYARDTWYARIIQTNIANLAGVPSVIFGILGLAIFVRFLALGPSLLSGALTMSLLILPIIIISTQEALRAIPDDIRSSAYALGATRWQVVRSHLLPIAAPGILTGVILSLSRAIGETAPLLVIGVATMAPFLPEGVLDTFTVLPVQIFHWTSLPQPEFHGLAAAGIIVLMAALLTMNLSAVLLRNYYEKNRPQ